MNQYFNFTQYFSPEKNQSWKPVAKIAAMLIGLGLLIFLLKELIIALLSAIFIGMGIFLLFVAIKLWHSSRYYLNQRF